MSAAPRPQLQQANQIHTGHDIVRFSKFLYGEQPGFFEVCVIDGDPLLQPLRRVRWLRYTPEQIAEIVKYLLEYVELYGNVYISRTLYRRKERNRAYALPSRIVFLDDAPERPALPYSAVVQTSTGRPQAYYRLETPQDAATIADLQRRAAHALGADKSGADVEQLVRIPESFNTKRGERYPVHIQHITRRTYTVEEIYAQCPRVANLAAAPASLDRAEVEQWHGNIEQLLGPDGLPRRLSEKSQARRVLTGETTPPSTSDARAFVCRGLVMHGYPDEEIAALLIHFCDYGASQRKGSAWLYQDIARLIAKERAHLPHITINSSRGYRAKAAQPLPQVERPKNGRPQRLTDEQYYTALQERANGANGTVLWNQAEAAAALGVSIPTIRRIEKRLHDQGLIERRIVRKKAGTYSFVVLYSAIKTPDKHPTIVRSAEAETVRSNAGNPEPERSIKEHTTPIVPPADAPSATIRLVDAARAALEAAAAEAGRATQKRFVATFRAYFPQIGLSDDALAREYRKALEARRRERTITHEHTKIAAAEQPDLERWARSYAWNHTKAQKDGHEKKAYMWGCRLAIVEAEIERRQAAGDWVYKQKRRRNIEPPTAPLVALAEAAPPAPADAVAPTGGCVPPQRLVADVQSMIEQPRPETQPRIDERYVAQMLGSGNVEAVRLHYAVHRMPIPVGWTMSGNVVKCQD